MSLVDVYRDRAEDCAFLAQRSKDEETKLVYMRMEAAWRELADQQQKLDVAKDVVCCGDPMLLQSTITCPHCSVTKTETRPTDACRFFYECTGCGTKPKPGDCCVFCSYGSVPCPPIQAERSGKSGAAACAGR